MNDKYELTNEAIKVDGHILHRIKALKDFFDVKKGDLGGFVESEKNLSPEDDCWIYDNGLVSENGCVYGNGCVTGNGHVSGNGCVCGNGFVYGNGCVSGNGCVDGHGCVYGNGRVSGNGCVYGNGRVSGNGCVTGNGCVYGNGCVSGYACVSGNGEISGMGLVKSNEDYIIIQGFGTEHRSTTFFRCKDGRVRVQCGCFYGTINQFRKQVKKTREGQIVKGYLLVADLMEDHFKNS